MLRKIIFTMIFVTLLAVPALAVTFDHEEHNEYIEDSPCNTCHLPDAFSIVPAKDVCEECHDEDFARDVEYPSLQSHGPVWAFNHRVFARTSNTDCASCHQQDFCLECHKSGFADEQGSFSNNMINVHRSEFTVTHPIAARTDPQLCSSCHENNFCVKCHNSFNRNDLAFDSHRRGFTDGTLGGQHAFYDDSQCAGCHKDSNGQTVLPSHNWTRNHAREARKNLATCQSCHPEGDICLQCHSARTGLMVNPHPGDWSDISSNLNKASGGKSCRKCH